MGNLRNTTLKKMGNLVNSHGIDPYQFFDRFWEEYKIEAKKETLFPETMKV